MNFAGLVVVAAGLFMVVVALRNTQNQVFPFFFNTSGAATSGSSNPISTILGGNCPNGQANVMGSCRPDPHNCGNGFVWINVGTGGTCIKVVG